MTFCGQPISNLNQRDITVLINPSQHLGCMGLGAVTMSITAAHVVRLCAEDVLNANAHPGFCLLALTMNPTSQGVLSIEPYDCGREVDGAEVFSLRFCRNGWQWLCNV